MLAPPTPGRFALTGNFWQQGCVPEEKAAMSIHEGRNIAHRAILCRHAWQNRGPQRQASVPSTSGVLRIEGRLKTHGLSTKPLVAALGIYARVTALFWTLRPPPRTECHRRPPNLSKLAPTHVGN